MMKTPLNNTKGFTLIEMLIAMAIGIMVLATATITYTKQNDVIRTGNQETQTRGKARLILDELVQEIRRAGYGMPPADSSAVMWDAGTSTWIPNPAKNTQNGVTSATSTSITYRANIDNTMTFLALDSTDPNNTGMPVASSTDVTATGFQAGDTVAFFDTEKPWNWKTVPLSSISTLLGFPYFEWGSGNKNDYTFEPKDDGSAVIIQKYHTITYTYNAGSETITVTDDQGTVTNGDDTTTTIANNVTNLTFTYYPTTGAAYTSPVTGTDLDLMRRMNISITVKNQVEETVTETFDTDVTLRNLGV